MSNHKKEQGLTFLKWDDKLRFSSTYSIICNRKITRLGAQEDKNSVIESESFTVDIPKGKYVEFEELIKSIMGSKIYTKWGYEYDLTKVCGVKEDKKGVTGVFSEILDNFIGYE